MNSSLSWSKTGVLFIGENPIAGIPAWRMYRLSVPPGKTWGLIFNPLKKGFSLVHFLWIRILILQLIDNRLESNPESVGIIDFRRLNHNFFLSEGDFNTTTSFLAPVLELLKGYGYNKNLLENKSLLFYTKWCVPNPRQFWCRNQQWSLEGPHCLELLHWS